jgi:hypothetical protein
VINSVSTRPGYAGYVPHKPAAAPAAETKSFDVTAPAKRPVAPVRPDTGSGIELARAYELASKQRQAGAVPRDLLWHLTGPGRP